MERLEGLEINVAHLKSAYLPEYHLWKLYTYKWNCQLLLTNISEPKTNFSWIFYVPELKAARLQVLSNPKRNTSLKVCEKEISLAVIFCGINLENSSFLYAFSSPVDVLDT